ncbi:octopamine receptor 1-like [Asterias rubens]|uniref:octopamine receptor 1-like n=1 Tax=Asterias rubens TaxID=7604 RepID=UPI001455486F|nr:octopamine receptor 1-like [Asterias rubens]
MAEAYVRAFQTIVGLLGIFGNSLVCVVIWRVRIMHTLTNVFIFNQAVVDFFSSLMLILSINVPVPEKVPEGVAGLLLCYLWVTRVFLWSSFFTSTTSLVSLTIERYVAIVFPFKYQVFFGRRVAAGLITLTWVYGFLSSGFNLVWVEYVEKDGSCKAYVLPEPPVVSAFLLLQLNFMVPATVMFIAYSHISITLKRTAKRAAPTTGASSSSTDATTIDGSLLRARRNTFKTLFIVFVVYMICWAPNTIIFSLFLLGVEIDLDGALYIISVFLVVCNSCANPIIYALKYRQFRKGLNKLLGRNNRVDIDGDITTVSGRTGQRERT